MENLQKLEQLFGLAGQVVVMTGGGGVLGRPICLALAQLGARVVVLDRSLASGQKLADEIGAGGGEALALACDVLDKPGLEAAARAVLERFGRLDILINGAGGNRPQATTDPQNTFFDLPAEALQDVFALNFMGTLLPCQVFGRILAEQKRGAILNISSMAAFRPLTRIAGYAAAKASINNFTQWLAVHIAKEYSPAIRVNAIAPGFFLAEQNRSLLVDPQTGELTARGRAIIEHTPAGRFGVAEELVSTVVWLLSPGAAFVSGVVIPIDGGFNAFSGV